MPTTKGHGPDVPLDGAASTAPTRGTATPTTGTSDAREKRGSSHRHAWNTGHRDQDLGEVGACVKVHLGLSYKYAAHTHFGYTWSLETSGSNATRLLCGAEAYPPVSKHAMATRSKPWFLMCSGHDQRLPPSPDQHTVANQSPEPRSSDPTFAQLSTGENSCAVASPDGGETVIARVHQGPVTTKPAPPPQRPRRTQATRLQTGSGARSGGQATRIGPRSV